jgi:hypothetical protein
MVQVRLLPGMTPEQGAVEVCRSIGFGRPEVRLMYVLEDLPDEQEP